MNVRTLKYLINEPCLGKNFFKRNILNNNIPLSPAYGDSCTKYTYIIYACITIITFCGRYGYLRPDMDDLKPSMERRAVNEGLK